MEMWGKCLTLAFLTVAVSAVVIVGQNYVSLDKKQVEVPVGSPLILKCNLSTVGYQRFWVAWYFNPTGSSFNESHNLSSSKIIIRPAQDSTGVKAEEILLNYTSKATKNNSGWYFCKYTVEIPSLHEASSNGTEVVIKRVEHTTRPFLTIVTSKQDDFSPIDRWLWGSVGASAFILAILIICILLRRRCRRSRGEDPVYANTRPVAGKHPSPRPAIHLDAPKKAPSSQNLRNPSPGRRYDEGKLRYKT